MPLNAISSSVWTIAVAALVTGWTAPSADASSRFSIENQTDTKVNVYIYSGGDTFCTIEEKLKTVSVNETDSFGCTGNGKNQCKIELYANGNEICKSESNACNHDAIKRPNNSAMTVTGTLGSGYNCEFDD